MISSGKKNSQSSGSSFQGKIKYFKKPKNGQWAMRLVPAGLVHQGDEEGPDGAVTATVHKNLGQIQVPNPNSRSEEDKYRTIYLQAKCLEKNCPACAVANDQKKAWGKDKPADSYLVEKAAKTQRLFYVYPVNYDMRKKAFSYEENPEPQIMDYPYRWNKPKGSDYGNLECEDWQNLVDLYVDCLENKGIDLLDENAGCVIVVNTDKVPTGYGTSVRNVRVHEVEAGSVMPLPKNWKEKLQNSSSLIERQPVYSHEELADLLDFAAIMEELQGQRGSMDKDAYDTELGVLLSSYIENGKSESIKERISRILTAKNKDGSEDGEEEGNSNQPRPKQATSMSSIRAQAQPQESVSRDSLAAAAASRIQEAQVPVERATQAAAPAPQAEPATAPSGSSLQDKIAHMRAQRSGQK